MPATDSQGLEAEGKRSHHPSLTPPKVELSSTQASQIQRPKHLVRDWWEAHRGGGKWGLRKWNSDYGHLRSIWEIKMDSCQIKPVWTHRELGVLPRAVWKCTLRIFLTGIPVHMIHVQGFIAAGLGMSKGWKQYKCPSVCLTGASIRE